MVAVLALAAGCKQFEPEVSRPAAAPAAAPTIAVSNVTDDAFTFTVSAGEGTGFFSYVVVEGTDVPSASKIFSVSVGGLVEETVDYSKSKSVTVELEELDFNTPYTICAVAGSVDGDLTEVVTKTVNTSDGVDPDYDDYEYEENELAVYFTEAVKLVDAKKVSAAYYAGMTADIFANKPVDSVEILEIEEYGDAVVFVLDSIPAGAHYAISIADGAFSDLAGNPLPGLQSSYAADKDGKLESIGLCGRMSTVPFDLDFYNQDTVKVITSMQQQIWLEVPEANTIVAADTKVVGSILYEGANYKHEYATYPTKMGFQWNSKTYGCVLVYPNAMPSMTGHPDAVRGDMVTITIPEKYVYDKYGNSNSEFVIGPALFSYGYSVEDVIGTYMCDGTSLWEGYDEEPWGFTVEASDDEEAGNVMITEYCDMECKIYADFDGDLGTLTMPIYYEELESFIYEGKLYDYYTFAYYSTYKDEENDMIFSMATKGTLECENDNPGYYFEVYQIPEGGVSAIDPDRDYLDYDYNLFEGPFKLQPAAGSSVKTNSSRFFGAEKYAVSLPCRGKSQSFSKKISK